LGLSGATWVSASSIIGAGWLFNALFAAEVVGGAAVLAWLIAAVMIMTLALCHAELGAMYPVSGGTARFPHFAFGSMAGIGFGFFSYMQAVTIAPVECLAFTQYASYYWPGLFNATAGVTIGTDRVRAGHLVSGRPSTSVSALHGIESDASAEAVRSCRVVSLDWRLDRVYFLAFLNPSRGQPDPALAARLASLCNDR
jgi:amino acid transporter